jgi:segregation and condensation protein B
MGEKKDESTMESLKNRIEALLFVSSTPMSANQLSNYLNEKPKVIESILQKMAEELKVNRGLQLEESNGRYQLTTAPEYFPIIEQYLGQEDSTSLSQASLEALSIVAYRQPVTRPDVDDIRGVNSDGVMRNLLNKGLIQEIGRSEGAGRPILYGTTNEFLQYFGLSSLKELPQFENQLESTLPTNGKILKD